MSSDYPLRVQNKNGSKRWGAGLREWALELAISDADYVAEEMYDGEVVVVDTRVNRVAYSTVEGVSNWVPEGSEV